MNWKDLWEVLAVFLIPFGGGIPAGVVLAVKKEIHWPMMLLLYLVSDIILALIFEAIVIGIKRLGRNWEPMGKFNAAMKVSVDKTIAKYGLTPGPFTLIMISFGVDPMTGRTAALGVGHGFLTGWALAIAGDLIYFSLLMVSTIFLNGILGDGTWTTIIILAAMFIVPAVIRRVRELAK